jgi:hypothetical protein
VAVRSEGFWSERRWEPIAPLAGVIAVVLWVVSFFVLEGATNPPDQGTPEEVLAYYEEDSGAILAGNYLFALAVPFFLWFLGSLRSLLWRAESGVARLATVAFGSGVGTAIVLLGFTVPSIAGALAIDEDEPLSAEAAQTLWILQDGFFVAAWFTLAAFFAATAVVVLRTRALPQWLAWVSLLFAVGVLVPWTGWAVLIFGFPLWVLVTSVLLWRRLSSPVEASAAAP